MTEIGDAPRSVRGEGAEPARAGGQYQGERQPDAPPLDVLDVAARRYHDARTAVAVAGMAPSSYTASLAYWLALDAMDRAARDVAAAYAVAAAIEREANPVAGNTG